MNTLKQQLETPLTVRSASRVKVRLLSVVLILLSTGIVATVLPSAMAAETASGTQFDPDDTHFQQLVSTCLDCHAIDNDSADYVGPTLKGVVGRRIASINSYGYSVALYEQAAMGVIWDESTLDRFLESPQLMAPGIAMTFEGLPDPDDRAQVIAWLANGPQSLEVNAPVAAALKHEAEVNEVLTMKADIEYGQYLAGKCLTCHSAQGATGSVPPIIGLPADYFINALLEYQQGERPNRVMQTMSEPLGKEELAALAAFFAQPAP